MGDIININEEKEKKERAALMEQIEELSNVLDESEEDSIYNAIVTLMSMEDEQFNAISETVLISLEDTLNKNKEILRYVSQEEKIAIENFEQTMNAIKQEIADSEFSDAKKDWLYRFASLVLNALAENEDPSFTYVSIPCQLCKDVSLPHYANNGDAGMDIYAPDEYTIAPGETVIIPTGFKVAIPQGYALLIQPRSGQSVKTKLRIANTPGLIDSGYRDEIGVIVENIEPPFKDIDYDFNEDGTIKINSILHGETYTISKGQRFAQMRLVQAPKAAFFEVNDIKEIEGDRGGGFGSSGTE